MSLVTKEDSNINFRRNISGHFDLIYGNLKVNEVPIKQYKVTCV